MTSEHLAGVYRRFHAIDRATRMGVADLPPRGSVERRALVARRKKALRVMGYLDAAAKRMWAARR